MGFGVLDYLYLGILGNHNFDNNGKMVSAGNVGRSAELSRELWSIKETHDGHNANNQISLSASTSRKGLLGESDPQSGLVGIKTTLPGKLRILNFGSAGGLASPSGKFRQIAEERDEISKSVPSSTGQGLRERFNGVFSQKIDWASLWKTGKEWIKNPLNMALFLWITCVTVSGAILFLVMTGMLDGVLPKKSQRNTWFEINNQIINALFTLMSLYQHPKRFHHLVLLCRWKPKDISQLRSIYCKNGTYKPNEWTHMTVVIVLLHVNCFAQYALCGLNLGYKRSERPAIGVGVCLSVAIAAPAIAGLYSILSPLGREYDLEVDEEAQDQVLTVHNSWPSVKVKSMERRFSFASRNNQRIVENKPVWRGGIFDIWEDINLACLSIFCSFCVFGWNMERLGFGNMYVHIATFLLFCTAPFWIFNLAAINIDNETVREVLGITGIVLCVFGVLYGGFWRIQMRKRFNLPANNLCCGKPAIGDCAHWLFCCCCSLAQEVRTADFYDIVEDKFCRKQMGENEPPMSPLPRENGLYQFTSDPSSPSWNSPRLYKFKAEDSHGLSRFSRNKSGTDKFNTAALVSCVQNFPKSRGPVVGILKGFAGLSGAILTQIYALIRTPDHASLIFMVAVGPAMVIIALMFIVRPVGGHKQVRPSDEMSFSFIYSVCLLLAAYLMAVMLVQDLVDLNENVIIIFTVILFILLLIPIIIPVWLSFFSETRDPAETALLHEPQKQGPSQSEHDVNEVIFSEMEDEKPKELDLLPASERQRRIAQLQAKLAQAAAEGAVRVKRRRGPHRGEDFTLTQALIKADFWLIFFSLLLGSGSGLTVIDNLGQMSQSLGYNDTHIFVSLISIWNFLGRVGGGYFSEIIVRDYAYPRPVAMAVAQVIMAFGHLFIAMGWPGAMYIGTLLIGLGYGAHWAIVPAAASELFGLKKFGALYNFLTLANPAGSLVFSGVIASSIYDSEAEKQAHRPHHQRDLGSIILGSLGSDEPLKCEGSICFFLTSMIMSGLCLIAVVLSMILVYRTRSVYAHLYGKSQT